MGLNASFIYGLLEGISCKISNKIKIVQVGANDGVTNDPLNEWVNNNLDANQLILIEPQSNVFEKLIKNYSSHPSAYFYNNAIGEKGQLRLYRINQQYNHLYRGITASGITSFNRDYVLGKISKNLAIPKGDEPEKYLESFTIDTLPLADLLLENHPTINIDFLQIDTEGFDDQVIYQSNIETFKPSVINFEFIHLSKPKQEQLYQYLSTLSYKIIHWSSEDACAIKL